VKRFAALLDGLLHAPGRNAKLRLIQDYLAQTPDPARGYALAALTGGLSFNEAKPKAIRDLAASRVDPVLLDLSYDYVGDLAETVALIWPAQKEADPPSLTDVVTTLQTASRREVPRLLESWLDQLDATGRWALLKLITGGLRVGVSARLARTALAQWGNQPVEEVEELWHDLTPPYAGMFAWLGGYGERPSSASGLGFRPLMLAHPLEEAEIAALDPTSYRAEWKWDGIRVQIVSRPDGKRLYSRTGDDVGQAFPDILAAMDFDAVLDGELLVRKADGNLGSFNDLQQRLNRKTPPASLVQSHPAFIRLYDMLFDGGEDLRVLPFDTRRTRLEAWHARRPNGIFDLSEQLPVESWDSLAALRHGAAADREGLMLKRFDSAYVAGRPKGLWFKWKRDPKTVDAVLMYAQRGHGKRSSFYSDFTFGCWRPDGRGAQELVPVGKAYFGFTDEELGQLDRWVRNHTTKRFGPVREVEQALVLEIAFEGIQTSTRHKSGIALRFPRVSRIRWDKPAAEADLVETLQRLIDEAG